MRRFAADGYAALCPNLYSRQAPGASPDDAAAFVRAQGGIADEQLVGDVDGAARHLRGLPGATGKVGVIGYCSGGRHDVPRGLLAAAGRRRRLLRGVRRQPAARRVPARRRAADRARTAAVLPAAGPLRRATTSSPRPRRRRRSRPSSTGWASRTSSTPTTARATRSSRSTGPPTGPRRPSTAGRRSSPSSAPTWRPEPCAPTSREKVAIEGSGKGADGWFALTHATAYVDHPVHAPYGHTVNIDFLAPERGPSARVAVELTEEDGAARWSGRSPGRWPRRRRGSPRGTQ